MNYQDRLLRAIPGGAHTYSRGFDQYPANAPQILRRGKGAYIYDDQENEFLDYGMALRAVSLGYAEDAIDEAAIRQIRNGNNLTRPSLIELEAAELLISLIDSVDMVKFTKNGSTATTAAIKLSRAHTGRELVARCSDHPFFSYDDWFIGSTPVIRGIPQETAQQTLQFRYNNIASLEKLVADNPGRIACVILEPSTTEEPYDNFLQRVKTLCRHHGIILIFDEMITGFRWHIKGAQHYYNITPDLCTFGKAMANGFSVAAVAGRREIMELGSIEFHGRERVFLLSTTHGAEMCGLGAFVATVDFIQHHGVIGHLWDYGRELVQTMNSLADEFGISNSFKAGGTACSPYYLTLDANGDNSLGLRTLFAQEMIRNGVLMPWIALSYRHGEQELARTREALGNAFAVYAKALQDGYEHYLEGSVIKPVFRKFN